MLRGRRCLTLRRDLDKASHCCESGVVVGRVLRSAFFWVYMATSLMVFWFAVAIPWLLITPFDRQRRFSHWYAYTWANHFLFFAPFWKVKVIDRDKVDDGEAYVMVCNHLSAGDILVTYALRKHFKWVSKKEVFKVPFLGWMMWMAGYIGIKRGDPQSRNKMLADCRESLERGSSIMLFPEGTRSETGVMRPFKRGAFVLACETKRPVLPMIIQGTQDALPKDSWIFGHNDRLEVRLRVLDPLDPADFDFNAKRLMAATRSAMEQGQHELKALMAAEAAKQAPGPKKREREREPIEA